MRGQGAAAKPALLRVDGTGKLDIVAFDGMKYTKVTLPNPPNATEGPRNPRPQSVTDMAFVDGKLYVAGLSNEEFASKLRSISYPFAAADNGTSVEIFHGNHGQFETRSPVYTFVPVQDRQPAASDCRLPVHATGEVPAVQSQAGRRRSSARRSPSSATAIGRST